MSGFAETLTARYTTELSASRSDVRSHDVVHERGFNIWEVRMCAQVSVEKEKISGGCVLDESVTVSRDESERFVRPGEEARRL